MGLDNNIYVDFINKVPKKFKSTEYMYYGCGNYVSPLYLRGCWGLRDSIIGDILNKPIEGGGEYLLTTKDCENILNLLKDAKKMHRQESRWDDETMQIILNTNIKHLSKMIRYIKWHKSKIQCIVFSDSY